MPSPQRIRIAKVRSVLLIVFALAVLSVLMYLLFGGNPFRPDVAIRVVVDDSGGMPPGSPVRLNGITIGKVESVELAAPPQGDRIVAIIMSIEAGALEFIPEDSMAEIGADNLLGDRLIDITAGRSPVPIQRGGTLRYEPPTEIDQAQVMASLEKNLRRVDALLNDIEMGRGSLARFVRDDAVYNSTKERLGQFERSLRSMRTTGMLGKLIESDAQYRSIQATLGRYDTLLGDLQAGRGAGGQFLQSSRLYDDLLKRIGALRQQLEQVKRNRLLSSDQDYQEWNRQVRRLMVAIDELNEGKGGLGELLQVAHTYESLNGAAQNLQVFLADFQQNPRKFLRVDLDLF
jgi:phospholipid/cholesterol/gamma-HCH transport system substrate-binding protein